MNKIIFDNLEEITNDEIYIKKILKEKKSLLKREDKVKDILKIIFEYLKNRNFKLMDINEKDKNINVALSIDKKEVKTTKDLLYNFLFQTDDFQKKIKEIKVDLITIKPFKSQDKNKDLFYLVFQEMETEI